MFLWNNGLWGFISGFSFSPLSGIFLFYLNSFQHLKETVLHVIMYYLTRPVFFTVSGTQNTNTWHVASIKIGNLSCLPTVFPVLESCIYISDIFHVMWVIFMSACQIHIEIEPQFELCLSTAILADFTFRDLWLSQSIAEGADILGCYPLWECLMLKMKALLWSF